MNRLSIVLRSVLVAAMLGGAVGACADERPAAPETPVATPDVSGREVAMRLADMIERRYVYPEIGKDYAQLLRGNADAGEYDALSGKRLADRLRADLQALHPDAHLAVVPDPHAEAGPAAAGEPPEGEASPGLAFVKRIAPDMEPPRWLVPDIAFVRYNLFPSGPQDIEATARFLDEYGQAKAIVFDLRAHRGGDLGEIDAIFARLVTEPTRLLTMATRKSLVEIMGMPPTDNPRMRLVEGDPEFISLEHWALPEEGKPRIKARIYLLTSGRTGSAAEHFALAIKVSGLGTVVGAPTMGANHFGGLEPVAGGLAGFIPVGRTFDPATGRDWEGTGVAPDIAVAAEDALFAVLEREGVEATKARAIADENAPPAQARRPGE